jgi:hypothetical protein
VEYEVGYRIQDPRCRIQDTMFDAGLLETGNLKLTGFIGFVAFVGSIGLIVFDGTRC